MTIITESTIEIKGRVVKSDEDHTATPCKTIELWSSAATHGEPLVATTQAEEFLGLLER